MDQKVYWEISGDMLTYVALAVNATDARDVLRYFSIQWQLKAENPEANNSQQHVRQAEFVQLRRGRAGSLYTFTKTRALGLGDINECVRRPVSRTE
ncbi:hypothetical protein AltI4_19030 [Alteromonas sp. I4]|nr:hypothetical protein AltI4_19030 [Alteromonas sp. I4]